MTWAFSKTAQVTGRTARTTAGSSNIIVSSSAGVVIGYLIEGTGIPAGTVVTNISGTTLSLSQNATSSGTNVPVTFFSEVITQTGIDVDHAGLASVSNVTAQTNGRQRVLTINAEIVINGTVTTSATAVEKLVFVGSRTLTINGTYNFGRLITNAQTGTVARGSGIRSASLSFSLSNGSYLDPRLIISTTGSFIGRNADIDCNVSTVRIDGSGTWDVTDCTTSWAIGAAQFRVEGTAATVRCDGWVADNISYQFFNYSGVNDLKGYLPINSDEGFTRGGPGSFIFNRLPDYAATKLSVGGTEQVTELENCTFGTATEVKSFGGFSTVGQIVAVGTFNVRVADSVDMLLPGVRVYTSSVATTGNNFYPGYDYNQRLVTLASTDANGQLAAAQRIVLGEFLVNNTQTYQQLSKRNGRTDDLWNIHFLGYGYLYAAPTQDFRSSGQKTIRQSLLADANVTLSESAAGALTSIGTLDDLYDAAKHWKTRQVQAQIEYPSISTQPVNGVGTVLDLGSRNLVIDGTAATAFAINTSTNTITIKASALVAGTKFAGMLTTGAVSLLGGATVETVQAGEIFAPGINTKSLSATTRISGLPTTGAISTGGALGFGTASTIAATGNLSVSSTDLSGTLTINTASAIDLTLTDCTGQVTLSVTGGGSARVILAGSTTRSILPATLPAGVTVNKVVTVRRSDGGVFNIAARRGSSGAYTDLPFSDSVTSVQYIVPISEPVEIAIGAAGYIVQTRTISTGEAGTDFVAELVLNSNVNSTLNVSSYLSNITTSVDAGDLVFTCGAGFEIPNIELIKTTVHYLSLGELSLRFLLPPGQAAAIEYQPSGLKIKLPVLRIQPADVLGVGVDMRAVGFIDTADAKTVDPTYVLNPRNPLGNRVEFPLLDVPNVTDPGQLAQTIWTYAQRSVTADPGAAAHAATQAAIAALPAPLTATQTRAQVDAALTAYDAAVPADLATLATAAQVTALGAPLQASSYTAPPSATSTAQAVRAELATELGRMDAAVSSRLASASYTAPTAPPTAAQNATAVRTELATELGRIDASVSSRLAASAYTAPTTPPTAAAIRAEIEATGGKLDKAMKAAQAAEDQTI